MATFLLENQHTIEPELVQTVTNLHFGGNTLINYNEIADQGSGLAVSVEDLSLTTLRYPGGAVTEEYFDITNPEAEGVLYQGNYVELVPLTAFLNVAKDLNSSVTIVIPTRHGLEKSAEQALLDGDYGYRQPSDQFVSDAASFAVEAITKALESGVRIDAFEIGNEFWGSGKMTAAEYGRLAAEIVLEVEDALLSLGIPVADQPDLIVQGITATGKYSPTPSSTDPLHLYELSDGTLWSSPSEYGVGEAPPGFTQITISTYLGEFDVPTQGFVRFQNREILDALREVEGAADALDGFVLHYYGDIDLSEIDTGDQFLFEVFEILSEINDTRSDTLPDLIQYVTEWNIRARETHPNQGQGGLIQASYLVEMFYELLTNGVEAAHIWPIRNEGTQLSSLLDVNGEGLSLSGEIFRLMSNTLIGLTPVLDYEQDLGGGSGHIDVHGFESEDREVLIISERDGFSGLQTLDLSNVLSGEDYFVTVQVLTTNGNPTNPNSEPIILYNGYSVDGSVVDLGLMLSEYSIAVVEITYINDSANSIIGLGGDDRIDGRGGDDTIDGQDGNDTLWGANGDDHIMGGFGNDTIYGDQGNDTLVGGDGTDALMGRAGDDFLLADERDNYVAGGSGLDTVSFEDANEAVQIWTCEEVAEFTNWVVTLDGIEVIVGTNFGDRFSIITSNMSFDGGSGRDVFEIWAGSDILVAGGAGDDQFFLYGDSDAVVDGGFGADEFLIYYGNSTIDGGSGDDLYRTLNPLSDTFDFGQAMGNDTIYGFDIEMDVLDFSVMNASEITIEQVDGGTLFLLEGEGSVFLHDVFDLDPHANFLLVG